MTGRTRNHHAALIEVRKFNLALSASLNTTFVQCGFFCFSLTRHIFRRNHPHGKINSEGAPTVLPDSLRQLRRCTITASPGYGSAPLPTNPLLLNRSCGTCICSLARYRQNDQTAHEPDQSNHLIRTGKLHSEKYSSQLESPDFTHVSILNSVARSMDAALAALCPVSPDTITAH